MADGILTPCNVACGFGIVTVNSPSGSTLQCDTWLWDDMPLNSPKRPPYWNFLVSISTTSLQSTCHFAPVSEILSKLDHPRQKKMTSCRFSRWRISAILDFRGPKMGSLKSPGTTSYRSSTDTIALNCLVFEKIAFFCILATDEQMDSTDAQSRSRYREQRLNNVFTSFHDIRHNSGITAARAMFNVHSGYLPAIHRETKHPQRWPFHAIIPRTTCANLHQNQFTCFQHIINTILIKYEKSRRKGLRQGPLSPMGGLWECRLLECSCSWMASALVPCTDTQTRRV